MSGLSLTLFPPLRMAVFWYTRSHLFIRIFFFSVSSFYPPLSCLIQCGCVKPTHCDRTQCKLNRTCIKCEIKAQSTENSRRTKTSFLCIWTEWVKLNRVSLSASLSLLREWIVHLNGRDLIYLPFEFISRTQLSSSMDCNL